MNGVQAAHQQSHDHRRAVLRAALKVFSDQGFAGATTRAIAAEAGVELGHLAYYFPTKLILWQQVLLAFLMAGESYLDQHLGAADLDDPLETARRVLPGYLRTYANNPRLTRMLQQEMAMRNERHDWVVEHLGRPIWERLSPLFQALAQRGHLSGAPPETAYFAMVGSTLILFGHPELIEDFGKSDASTTDWQDRAIAHILSPILGREPINGGQATAG